MKKAFLAVIAVIVVLAGGLMLSYNGLAGSKEAVETAEADVEYHAAETCRSDPESRQHGKKLHEA